MFCHGKHCSGIIMNGTRFMQCVLISWNKTKILRIELNSASPCGRYRKGRDEAMIYAKIWIINLCVRNKIEADLNGDCVFWKCYLCFQVWEAYISEAGLLLQNRPEAAWGMALDSLATIFVELSKFEHLYIIQHHKFNCLMAINTLHKIRISVGWIKLVIFW